MLPLIVYNIQIFDCW